MAPKIPEDGLEALERQRNELQIKCDRLMDKYNDLFEKLERNRDEYEKHHKRDGEYCQAAFAKYLRKARKERESRDLAARFKAVLIEKGFIDEVARIERLASAPPAAHQEHAVDHVPPKETPVARGEAEVSGLHGQQQVVSQQLQQDLVASVAVPTLIQRDSDLAPPPKEPIQVSTFHVPSSQTTASEPPRSSPPAIPSSSGEEPEIVSARPVKRRRLHDRVETRPAPKVKEEPQSPTLLPLAKHQANLENMARPSSPSRNASTPRTFQENTPTPVAGYTAPQLRHTSHTPLQELSPNVQPDLSSVRRILPWNSISKGGRTTPKPQPLSSPKTAIKKESADKDLEGPNGSDHSKRRQAIIARPVARVLESAKSAFLSDEPGISAEPLRSRPQGDLQLSDFRINPNYLDSDFAFADTLRGRDARRCLPGCTDPVCCGRNFLHLAVLSKNERSNRLPEKLLRPGSITVSALNGLPDAMKELFRNYLGSNWRLALLQTSRAETRNDLLLHARAYDLAQKHGKHRQSFARRKTPPGFWRTDMPSTQEEENYRTEAARMEREQISERAIEARREGGRWLFRDEVGDLR